ncbi:MAG: ribose-5-phosphate isomerase RpiA [Ignavibacteriae bacterium]|nr:ribose-5-phosphate isomerase RpiA [Ignavibacteriota bacterium]MCB9257922.1 ribose-5-phosphate isomerase RpiA [Ignavibacteriales bacterium]
MNEEFKKLAAEKAVEEIESGMVVGLGSGSTVFYAIQKLAQEIRTGNLLNIVAIASSIQTEKLANKLDIPLITFHDKQKIDVTIDGADEVDKYLNLIKGGGAAHLREKILVQASDKFIVVIDDSKLSNKLGEKWAVPVEVIKFASPVISSFIESINGEPNLRTYESGIPVLTDEGNYIIDANFGVIQNPFELAEKLENRAGIVEHGLFLRLSSKVIVAGQDGIKILEK